MLPDIQAARARLPVDTRALHARLVEKSRAADRTRCCTILFAQEVSICYSQAHMVEKLLQLPDEFPVLESVISCVLSPVLPDRSAEKQPTAKRSVPQSFDTLQMAAFYKSAMKRLDVPEFLYYIGEHDVYTILGFQITIGTIQTLPFVSRTHLLATAIAPLPSDPSRSLANKARAKHCQRGGLWGAVKGNIEFQNEQALNCVRSVLAEATWVNHFALTANERVLEVRLANGQGLRWTVKDGPEFRGFIEPFL